MFQGMSICCWKRNENSSAHFRQTLRLDASRRCYSTLATFHYLRPLEEYQTIKPFHINIPEGGIPGATHTNEVSDPYRNVPVSDIRGRVDDFSLDRQGFEIVSDRDGDVQQVMNVLEPEKY